MNWVSKKLILSKLKTYFHIDNDNNIQISLTGRKQIKCSNLILKPEAINAPQQLVHIENCQIKTLNISYGANQQNQEPMQIKIDSLKLTLKFNTKRKFQWQAHQNKKKQRPVLKQFYKAVGSEEQYTQRSFLQEQIYQLKRMFGQFFISRLAFSITNIDVSLMCIIKNKPFYLGCKIQEIEFRHKIIIKQKNKQVTISEQNRQLHGLLKNIGIYLAQDVQNQFAVNKVSALQKQTKKKRSKRHKKYIMTKNNINIFYNFDQKHLAIYAKSLNINIQEILLYQFKQIADYLQQATKVRPHLRPGQGKIKIIGSQKIADARGVEYTKTLEVSQGTLQWWQVFGSSIISKFNQRENLNIIRNRKFKRYLYCLLYRYTFGAKNQLEEIIDEYQFFKTDMQIINYNKFIIQRVNRIQMTEGEDIQLKGFLVFLQTIIRTDKNLQKLRLSKISYKDIQNSNVITNMDNCKKFIRMYDTNLKDNQNLDIKIGLFQICICQSKQSYRLKAEAIKINPSKYDLCKRQYLSKFCEEHILTNHYGLQDSTTKNFMNNLNDPTELKKRSTIVKAQQKILIQLVLKNLSIDSSVSNSIYLKFDHFQINDHETSLKIAKLDNFCISLQDMHPEIYKWQISVQKKLEAKIDFIFLHLDLKFLQKCFMIKSFVTPPLIEQKVDTRNFISKFIAKKIPQHQIFEDYSNVSKNLIINECCITIPVLDKERTLQFSLKGIQYEDPVNDKISFSINQIFLIRSNMNNIKQKLKKKHRKEPQTDKSILLVNTQPFSGFSSSSLNKQVNYIFIPFFLIQISCQDLYYINNIAKSLSELLSNQYYFPKPIVTKQAQVSEIKEASIQFTRKMHKIVEMQKVLELKFEGIQFYLVTDTFYEPNNKILGILLDYIHVKRNQKFFQDNVQFSIKDLYIHNCLQDKKINKDQLVKCIKGQRNLDDKSIIQQAIDDFEQLRDLRKNVPRQENQSRIGDLLLYTEQRMKQKNSNKNIQKTEDQLRMQNGFLYLQAKSFIYINEQKSINEIFMKIVPIFIFFNEKFFEQILTVFNVVDSLASQTIISYFQNKRDAGNLFSSTSATAAETQRSSTNMNQILPFQENVEVLKSKQFQQLTYLYVHLQRINFLVNKGRQIIFNMTIKQLSIKHKTQPYVKKFNFSIKRFTLIDTSEASGKYPVIFDAKLNSVNGFPLIGYYVQYQSQILRHKENKSAYFYMKMQNPQISFLKKKIIQLTNLIMNTLNRTIFKNQKQELSPEQIQNFDQNGTRHFKPKKVYEQQMKQGSGKNSSKQPGFCYYIELIQPTIKLIRGSLSQEGFDSKAKSIIVSNLKQNLKIDHNIDIMQQFSINENEQNISAMMVDITKMQKTDKNILRDDESFVSCSRIDEENYENFRSFQRIDNDYSQKIDAIYIKLRQFVIDGFESWNKKKDREDIRPMLLIDEINMQFKEIVLDVAIPHFEADFTQQDYRVLIRITQQNFGETPILFMDKITPKMQTKISIRTAFNISNMLLNLRTPVQNPKNKQQQIKVLIMRIQNLKGKNDIWTTGQNETQLALSKLSFQKINGEQFIIYRAYHEDIENKKLSRFHQKPEKKGRIKKTKLEDFTCFNELQFINKRIWKKLKLNDCDYFQFYQTKDDDTQVSPEQIVKAHAVKQTNTGKITKWIAGMCKKCFKCCNCCVDKQQNVQHQQIQKTDSYNQIQAQEGWSDQNIASLAAPKNRNDSMIYQLNQILDFEDVISEQKIEQKRNEEHVVYLDFVIKPNGQKHMYLQAKNLEITIQKQNALMSAINFLNKPYANPEFPEYIRMPQFNNFKPFKMVIQVQDTLMQLKNYVFSQKYQESENSNKNNSFHDFEQSQERNSYEQEKIILQLNTLYQSSSRGDNINGPGKSSMRIETLCQMFYNNNIYKKVEDNGQQFMQCQTIEDIRLSDQMKICYDNQQVTPYGNQKKKKSEQKIIITPCNKSHRQKVLQIIIPIFLIKTFERIYKNTFPGKQQSKQDNQISNQNLQKDLGRQEDSIKENNKNQQSNSNKKPITNKNQFMSRVMYIPNMLVGVAQNSEKNYIQASIRKVKYAEAQYIQPASSSNLTIRNIKATFGVKYWNLKMGVFEPCLEPWGFKIHQVSTLKDQVTGNMMTVKSNITKQNIIDDIYYNDLNINASIALYQTYKQLMIKYQEEDNEVQQTCYDLTSIDSKDINFFNDQNQNIKAKDRHIKKNFNPELNSCFTRIFDIKQKYPLTKNTKIIARKQFNPKQLYIYVYHSYFDHTRRKKRITYRTPYRIFNSSNIDLYIDFLIKTNKINQNWQHKIRKNQYYAIPGIIYDSDMLASFSKEKNDVHNKKYVSIRYLMETRGKSKRYTPMSIQSKIWKLIFKYSSHNSDKLLDPNDLILIINDYSLVAVTVKAPHKIPTQRRNPIMKVLHDYKVYDTYAIILSPMIIQNYSYNNLTLRINRRHTLFVGSNEKLQISQYFSQNILETIFQFEEDNFHRQFQFFKFQESQSQINMEIDKLQSLKLKIYRETCSTCQIQIYADWNIQNRTKHNFSMRFGDRVFLIDQTSFSCISDLGNNIDFSIIGEELDYSKRLKSNNIAKQIILGKKVEEKRQYQLSNLRKQGCCSCCKGNSTIYENIQFVLNTVQDQIFSSSKRLQIRYRYQIRNLSSSPLKLFQQNQDYLIADLTKFESTSFIFYYDFIPKMFFLQLLLKDQFGELTNKLNSCKFDLQKFPGSKFAIKIKRNQQGIQLKDYYLRFHYFVVHIKRNEEQIFIDILDANLQKDFPIYMDNLTDYNIRITVQGQQFSLKSRERVPFAWNQLIQQDNMIQVSIENQTQIYRFNKKQAFEPIKIIDENKKKNKHSKNSYKKESCYVGYEYMNIAGTCVLILDMFDNKLRIHNAEDGINIDIKMTKIRRMEAMASKIDIYTQENNLIQIVPGSKSIKSWKQALHECINVNVVDKIHFTIQSYKNSRFFFFRTIDEDDNKSNMMEISIKNLNMSVISSQPEEILLFNCQQFQYTQNDRLNKLNYKKMAEQISQRVITFQKVKISNQISQVNPVVLSQIKKSTTPFLEIRLQKMNLLSLHENSSQQISAQQQLSNIIHYKQITVFMDEAQIMVEAGLFAQIMQMKSNIQFLTNQYAVGETEYSEEQTEERIMTSNKSSAENRNKKLVNLNNNKAYFKEVQQVYINFIEIKPLKMTVSVNMEHHENQKVQKNIISFLRYVPLGVQNAIIEIDSFTFFHVFFDQEQFYRIMTNYYYNSIYYQVLYNAGSYDMLAPFQIITGVGAGVKNIFYDPFYQFVKKKEIQAFGKRFCEGVVSLLVFLLSAISRIIAIIFKLISMLTFDREFRTKRETFRKQIFKSPLDGAILGAKHFWKVFKSFFQNFLNIKKDYSKYFLGYFWGFILCVINVVPWIIKLVVSVYDFLYVVVLGFLNWGYYQESAMKNRSRPPRLLQQNVIHNYNYRLSYGYELIRKNNLQEIDEEQIYFVKRISKKDQYNYLILSNNRILYNDSKIKGCNEFKLYQIQQVETKQLANSQKFEIQMDIRLSMPNTTKIFFLNYNVSQYTIKFSQFKDSVKFIRRLKRLASQLKHDIQFILTQKIQQALDLQKGFRMMEDIIEPSNGRMSGDQLVGRKMLIPVD